MKMTKDQQRVSELRDITYQEIVNLFEGDSVAADKWITSSVRGLGNHVPLSLMGTELGIQKIRKLVGQLEHGVLP